MNISEEKRHEIARDVSDYWKHNGFDSEFYENCEETVGYELYDEYYKQGLDEYVGSNEYDDDYDKIMDLIENKYINDNWEAIELFENTDEIIVQYRTLIINDMYFRNVYSIKKNDNEIQLLNAIGEEISYINYHMINNMKILD